MDCPGNSDMLSLSLGQDWIPLPAAAGLLNVSVETVRRLVKRGQISVRRLPGCHPKVNRTEVLALAERSVTTATVDGPRPF